MTGHGDPCMEHTKELKAAKLELERVKGPFRIAKGEKGEAKLEASVRAGAVCTTQPPEGVLLLSCRTKGVHVLCTARHDVLALAETSTRDARGAARFCLAPYSYLPRVHLSIAAPPALCLSTPLFRCPGAARAAAGAHGVPRLWRGPVRL